MNKKDITRCIFWGVIFFLVGLVFFSAIWEAVKLDECSGKIIEKFKVGDNLLYYYFVVDNKDIEVSMEIYYQYEIGDFFEQKN